MQVKKFEARTMKEALEMVKAQMGPDAIILSVRDNNRSFGLVGEGSVEITAAVTEDTLHKKKFVESRLRDEDKERMAKSSAKSQKQLIDRMVNRYVTEKEAKTPRPFTRTRYIDIDDEAQTQRSDFNLKSRSDEIDRASTQEKISSTSELASERIRNAAQRAWSSMQSAGAWREPEPRQAPVVKAPVESVEIQNLKTEIASLKQVLAQFQQMPQTFSTTQYPGASYGLSYEVSAMFEKLTAAGIAEEIAAEMLTLAQQQLPALKLKNKSLIEAWTAKHILTTTLIANEKSNQRVQIFVGPAGSGKTASLIKMASHLVVREGKKVALVTTDTMKVGATDQMRIYAQILNVPFAVVRQKSDWDKIMTQLSDYDAILVDYSGVGLKTMQEISFIRNLIPAEKFHPQVHLVLSCLAKDSDLTEIGKRYQVTGFQDVIFTGLDESNQHGTIYNFMKRFSTPLHSFGIGTRVPEDFEVATKERVLDLIFKITKMAKSGATQGSTI